VVEDAAVLGELEILWELLATRWPMRAAAVLLAARGARLHVLRWLEWLQAGPAGSEETLEGGAGAH
jgi:hypothetical protein